MQVLFLYRPRKSKPRVKIELRKQQYTVTLFDCNFHLAQVTILWQMQKLMCYCTVFALFSFEFEDSFQAQAPGVFYFSAGSFLLYEFGGVIFGILRYHSFPYFVSALSQ